MDEMALSRRDRQIVARHEVPEWGKRSAFTLNGAKLSGISPRRGREGSARGFNPGNPGPRRRALKGRQIERRHNTCQTCKHFSPFQGEPFVLDGSQG
jgi:hypothetical protein